jgi:hypothetical protein
MLERENANMLRISPVINRKRETRHQVSPHSRLNEAPALRSIQNRPCGEFRRIEELPAQRGNSLLVKPSGLDQLRFGIGMINQTHPIARRAACMTSS